jgi:hypothetical protein
MTSSTTATKTSDLWLDLGFMPGEAPPRIRQCPDVRAGKVAAKVIARARKVGLALDPWQRDVILDAQSVDEAGLWKTPRVAVAVPRQNGKGAIIEAIEIAFLTGAFGPDARLLIHSAHEFKTAQNGFQRLASYFDTVPELSRLKDEGRVKVGTAAAREFVTVVGRKDAQGRKIEPDRTVKFLARSKGSGRGFSADLLILDEAQELSEEVWAAILPTVSARPNAQIWLFGTPPSETMNGEVFTRFRENALAGNDVRLSYFEWSATDDDDFGSPETWAKTNPAYGVRISEDGVRDEWLAMDEDTFCRERLGMFDGAGALGVIPEDAWAALVSESDPTSRVVFAIDVAPDRSRASIGVAGLLDDDRVMVQAIENRKGVGWVVPRLAELTKRWPYLLVVLDSGGPAASLLPDLKKAKVRRVHTITATEVARSCGHFYDLALGSPGGVDSDGNETEPTPARLAHPDQPVLNEALASARKRPLGEAWAWHRKDATTDITPLVAVTFAAYGLSVKRNAARRETGALVL